MEGMNDTAPREAVGCILDAGQDAKMEILDNFPIGRSARNAIRLLTTPPRKIKGLEAFGIEIVEQVGVG